MIGPALRGAQQQVAERRRLRPDGHVHRAPPRASPRDGRGTRAAAGAARRGAGRRERPASNAAVPDERVVGEPHVGRARGASAAAPGRRARRCAARSCATSASSSTPAGSHTGGEAPDEVGDRIARRRPSPSRGRRAARPSSTTRLPMRKSPCDERLVARARPGAWRSSHHSATASTSGSGAKRAPAARGSTPSSVGPAPRSPSPSSPGADGVQRGERRRRPRAASAPRSGSGSSCHPTGTSPCDALHDEERAAERVARRRRRATAAPARARARPRSAAPRAASGSRARPRPASAGAARRRALPSPLLDAREPGLLREADRRPAAPSSTRAPADPVLGEPASRPRASSAARSATGGRRPVDVPQPGAVQRRRAGARPRSRRPRRPAPSRRRRRPRPPLDLRPAAAGPRGCRRIPASACSCARTPGSATLVASARTAAASRSAGRAVSTNRTIGNLGGSAGGDNCAWEDLTR